MRLTIELPLPPSCASPNFRGHTRTRAAKIAMYRGLCSALASRAVADYKHYYRVKVFTPRYPLRVSYTFYLNRKAFSAHGRYVPRDESNAVASMKAAEDALQDANIIPGDTPKYLSPAGVHLFTRQADHKGAACVVMVLEDAAEPIKRG